MRGLIVLGVALLCMSQVQAEKDDWIKTMFEQKTKGLAVAKASAAVPTVVLATDDYDCDAQKIVSTSQTLVKNTVDIFADSFNVVYNAVYVTNSECTFNAFRCFLKEFTDTKKTVTEVVAKVTTYKDTASGLFSDISLYFTNCVTKTDS